MWFWLIRSISVPARDSSSAWRTIIERNPNKAAPLDLFRPIGNSASLTSFPSSDPPSSTPFSPASLFLCSPLRMDGGGEETGFEVAIVVPKNCGKERDDCVEFLVWELKTAGLIVERVRGISDEFIKLAAPIEILGRVAAELQMQKLTYIGLELRFQWDEVTAFVTQPDGSLFSWCERFRCFHHLIYGIVNNTDSDLTLRFGGKELQYRRNESLLKMMEAEGIVKQVFPTHDETKRKQLLRTWALNWLDFTWQPIDEIYSYFGTKIATYFSFLGMYTRWLFFPATLGLGLQLVDIGPLQPLVLPAFFIFVIIWAALFFQFWKRKNSALLASWGINYTLSEYKALQTEQGSLHIDKDSENKIENDKPIEKKILQRDEWIGLLLKIRNNAIIVLAIVCLQLPFELAYAYFYEVTESDVMRYALTAAYLLAIQFYTRVGGKVSVILIKYEKNQGEESSAASLVYKVFGLYFVQSYIGLFYHALLHRNLLTLRQILIQRLIVSQILENMIENSIPFLKYTYKKYRAIHKKKKHDKGSSPARSIHLATRVEKEFLKPSYTASIGEELEDGLFDDFLELALQFGMIMMFACAFPLVFCFATLTNVTEIRADALKLIVMYQRPIPRAAATIGAWLNIFQFLIVMSICTNCVLLVCLYDQEGKWKIEPGLAAILIMEHALLLIKFGFSHFVPEEPAWVRANRMRNVVQARDVYSKQLLRSISTIERKQQ
ncbi:anoctamin-like protein Os01g0706700 [Zingiber officinale]|uniref:anoctamin-like protein Os01g0706700 n=1 Tax=Zingiber officinale TaxID=94328 RepID=UPI001C4DB471|nr:anoctamin-like protein Os01g0706700 [Zingiber officinale]